MRFASLFLLSASWMPAAVHFEPNRGQSEGGFAFLGRAGSRVFGLEAHRVWHRSRGGGALLAELEDANRRAPGSGEGLLGGVSHYALGRDADRWRWGVPHYSMVRFAGVYAGIDVVYHARRGALELDFLLAPGADAAQIRLRFPERARVSPEGDLLVGAARFRRPQAWQSHGGKRHHVEVWFALLDPHRAVFRLGPYNGALPLTIDPIIEFATYLGGSDDEWDTRMVAGADGSIYLAGNTTSADFPAAQLEGSPLNRPVALLNPDVYVTKLKPDASAVEWSLFVGGTAADEIVDLEQDHLGNIYLLGGTASANLPVTSGAFRNRIHPSLRDLFVLKLDAVSGRIKACTYLGVAPRSDLAVSDYVRLAVDPAGGIYVGGSLDETLVFRTTPGAFQGVSSGPPRSFLMRLTTTAAALVYATGFDLGSIRAMAVDASGNLIVAGASFRQPFPALHPIPGVNQSPLFPSQAYVAKLNAQGSALLFASQLHGAGRESGMADVKLDRAGNILVFGLTSGREFPQVNPLIIEQPPGSAVPPLSDHEAFPFLAKLPPEGGRLLQSTLIQGPEYQLVSASGFGSARRLVLRPSGVPCLAGLFGAGLRQTPGGLVNPESWPGLGLVCVDDAGSRFAVKTLLPGVAGVYRAVAAAPDGALLFAGTSTGKLPVTPGVVQPRFAGVVRRRQDYSSPAGDAFVLRVSLDNPRPQLLSVSPAVFVLDNSASGTTPAFLLNGSGFAFGAQVQFNGQPVESKFVWPWQIEAAGLSYTSLQPGPIQVTVSLPGPGGGISEARTINVVNAAPLTISVSPAQVTEGAGETKVVVRATNLSADSVLRWNGEVRPATFVRETVPLPSTRLELVLPPAELARPAVAEITVTNPRPGGGTSPVARFTVLPRVAPSIPALMQPWVFSLGRGPLGPRLTVGGTNFTAETRAFWDGQQIPAEVAGQGGLSIEPPAADLGRIGTHDLYVANGEFRSNTVQIFIVLDQRSLTSVSDPVRRRLYVLSAPETPAGQSNLLTFDLDRRELLGSVPVGITSGITPAVSDDGRYVYLACVSPRPVIRRYNADTQQFDLEFEVRPAKPGTRSLSISSVVAVPGSPGSVVVSISEDYAGRVTLFDEGRQRGTDTVDLGLAANAAGLATRNRIFLGTFDGRANERICWAYLDYDDTGITGGQVEGCAAEPDELHRDNGLSYLTDGRRMVPVAFFGQAGWSPQNPVFLHADLARRRIYVQYVSQALRVTEFDLDTLQQRVKFTLSSTGQGVGSGHMAADGQLVIVTGYFIALAP